MAGLTSLLPAGEVVVGKRLRLSRLDQAGLASISGWLPVALAPDWQFDDVSAELVSGGGVLVSDEAGSALGVCLACLDQPFEQAVSLPLVAIEPAARYRGLGSEAVLTLERHLRQGSGLTHFYAPVPDGRGLAIYFWLRLGYRPLTRAEAPWPLTGPTSEPRPGIWLLRDEA